MLVKVMTVFPKPISIHIIDCGWEHWKLTARF
jgi:hypothetical protein